MVGLWFPFTFHQPWCNLSMSKLAHCIQRQLCAIMPQKITLCYSVFNSLKQEIGWLPIGKKYLVSQWNWSFLPLSWPLAIFHLWCDVKEWVTVLILHTMCTLNRNRIAERSLLIKTWQLIAFQTCLPDYPKCKQQNKRNDDNELCRYQKGKYTQERNIFWGPFV